MVRSVYESPLKVTAPRSGDWMGKFSASPSRRWLLAALAVALLVLAVGIVSVSSHNESTQRVVAAGEWVNFEAVPLTPRAFPLIAWTGREVVIFGGGVGPSDGKAAQDLNDGAIYDPVTDAWHSMAAAPFEPPLAVPTGTWTGSELLVVGVPCKEQSAEGTSVSDCVPGGLKAGAFDPTGNKWREVTVPPVLSDGGHQYGIEALGYSTEGSVFALKGGYWIVSRGGTWTELPMPPLRARSLCVVGDQLLAVNYTDDSTYQDQLNALEQAQGEIPPSDLVLPELRSTMSVATLDLSSRDWETIPRSGIEGAAPQYLNSTCAPNGVYVYSAGKADRPESSNARFDAAARSWEPIAAPPGDPNVDPPAVFVDDRLIIWGDSLLQYDPTTNGWTDFGLVEPPTTVVPAGDHAVLYYFPNGEDVTAQYRLFKPSR